MLNILLALGLAAANGARAVLLQEGISEWFWLSSVATENYLYFTGGEFYQTVNGVVTPSLLLFFDKQRNKISRYGGWPYDETDFPSILWSSDAGSTNVTWVNETDPSADGLSADSPGPFASANAYTDSTYYNFGGNVFMPNALPNMTVLSGLVTKDLVAQNWTNSTAVLPNQSKYRTQSRMVYAPNFGGNGFLVVVGGESPPTEASQYETGTAMVDMATISLYDIKTGSWFTQTATGDVPPPRSEFCAVGAASNNSFELFVYGGSTNSTFDLNSADDEGYLNVYALSLPGFQWFQSNSTTTERRACHTCSVIGNRQMVSIGGRLPSSLQVLGGEQDPWASGLGVFDMTEFEWVDHYNAAAEAYESPDVVKNYYASNYKVPNWSDPALASAFAFTPSTNSSSNNSTSSGGSSSSSSPSSNAGPIAGGVVGGIAIIAAVILGLWFWQRRRKQGSPAAADADEAEEMYSKPPQFEAASTLMYEVDDNSRSEMEGFSPKPQFVAELPVDDEHQRLNGAVKR